uniref:ferroxidase n=1 Tax=Leptobrachium leishanense TaxID=445787 RepID=A0A8C5PA31_9ANUR
MKLFVICLVFLSEFGLRCIAAKDRIYYIGIQEINWNYAPSDVNIISGNPVTEDEHASTFLLSSTNRIGKVYKKAVYVQYTDDSYTVEIPKPNWLGFLGPIIRTEVGDTITVHLKNFASRPYSLHSHGVQYTKENEGAKYPDKNSQSPNNGAAVNPGDSFTYTWEGVRDQGPTDVDGACVTRVYHSHVDGPMDVYSGLVGPLIVCKPDQMKEAKDNDLDEFILMFSVVDENLSWYLDENIKTFCSDPSSVDKEDEDFQESNKMHSINGYMYGNLPGLSMCNNKHVTWYLFGMGNEVDIHSAYFHGQVLTQQRYRADTVSLFPATMVQGDMVPNNIGKWLLSCQVNDHLEGGMQAIYEVKNCPKPVTQRTRLRKQVNVRNYYIAAEEIIWNYGPTLTNQFSGQKLDDPESESAAFFEQNEVRIGGSYKKAVYMEYTDATFTKRKERTGEEEHMGLLGPTILAQVGDVLKVTFRNKATRPYSIQAHGVSYDKTMEGAAYKTSNDPGEQSASSSASHVSPGDTFTYEWNIPEAFGSTIHDRNCLPWIYFSAVNPVKDTNTGLVGPLLVCKSLVNNKQIGVNHSFFLLPAVFDENQSWLLDENIKLFTSTPDKVNKDDEDFQESNMMHSINGYMYGNQPGLDMCTGNSVRWYLMGIGSEVDMHGIHFSGNTVEDHHSGRRDTTSIFPHISYSLAMEPDNEGLFDVECMTTDHYTGGMKQHYRVKACDQKKRNKGSFLPYNVIYYIAAEEVEWDYSPNRTWEHAMHVHRDESPGEAFLGKNETLIGSKYKKAVYREYTDKTFLTPKERTEEQEHLGLLGPLIKAKTRSQIKIVFHNKASRPYSIYAHGIKPDGNSAKAANPGQTKTYIWNIPERSGPNPRGDADCITWAYYSNVDKVKDIYSGLIGPLVVCKSTRALLTPLTRSKKSFSLLFMINDENQSWYIDENIKTYCSQPDNVNKEDDAFVESNKMHAINGKMYANLHGLTMQVGDHILWHLIGLGNEVDLHTVHFHAHSFKYQRITSVSSKTDKGGCQELILEIDEMPSKTKKKQ